MNGPQVMELSKYKKREMNRNGHHVTRYLNGINVPVHLPMISVKSLLCDRKNWAEDARDCYEVASWSGIESAAAKESTATQPTLFE